MIVITWVVLIMCAGGGRGDLLALAIAAIVTGLPAVIIALLLQFLEGLMGKNGKYVISSLGLLPLMLIIYNQGRGDHFYMITILTSGLLWSIAWIGTAILFLRRN